MQYGYPNMGCEGGWYYDAWEFVKDNGENGVATEASYGSYQGMVRYCDKSDGDRTFGLSRGKQEY